MPSRKSIALLIGVCLAGGREAQTDQEPLIESHKIDNESIPPRVYWTKERMKKAVPAPLPSDGAASAAFCASLTGLLFVTDLSQQPYASAGSLFFLGEGGKKQFCTAQFTESGRTLLTAAHCVRDEDGQWYTHFYFVPRYDGEENPAGVELSLVATWRKYWDAGADPVNRALDYAFFRTSSFSSRKWLQLGTPEPYPFWLAIGYAKNSAYSGKKLVQIMGPKGQLDRLGGIVQMSGNPMEDGASGGGWIANPGTCSSAGNVVVGLTASRNLWTCELNSPLFNDETRRLLRSVRHPVRSPLE